MTPRDERDDAEWEEDEQQWQRDQYAPWEKVILFLTSFPFVALGRMLWQWYPGLELCVLFWLIALSDEPLRWRFLGPKRKVAIGLTNLGALGNALATIANGGFMPVLNHPQPKEGSLWIPLTPDSRLPWLCDIYWGGTSIGDGCILLGLLLLLIIWLGEWREWWEEESVAYGRKLPGLGIG